MAPVLLWEVARENLAIERVVGHGAFGVVSKAYLLDLPGIPDWTVVAVKSLQGDILRIMMKITRMNQSNTRNVGKKRDACSLQVNCN